MIKLAYEEPYEGTKYFTSLKRLENGKWEWNPCRVGEDCLKNLKPPIFGKNELKAYIQLFERIKNISSEDPTQREKFLEYYIFDYGKSFYPGVDEYPTYSIIIEVQNKYNKSFVYGDEKVLQTMQYEEWDDEYLGTPESWGGISSPRDLTEEDLQDYINQLIAEYEEVTGEEYERLE